MTAFWFRHKRESEVVSDRTQYRLYMVLVLPIALICVILRRVPLAGSKAGDISTVRTPFISEVMELSHNVVPWIFMGR